MLVENDNYYFYLQFALSMKPKFEKMVVVDFFWRKIRSKSQINQKSTKHQKRVQPLSIFSVPG